MISIARTIAIAIAIAVLVIIIVIVLELFELFPPLFLKELPENKEIMGTRNG